MGVDSTPLRWPTAWKDPGMLSLLQATPVRQLLLDSTAVVPGLADQARRLGLTVIDPGCDSQPDVRATSGASPGGWGLRLVARLCANWGTHRDAAGATHVWCDLPN